MTKKAFSVDDNIFIQYTVMIIGITLCAIGVNAFLTPANLLSGGLTGIAVLLNKLYGFNQGVVVFLINIPIFIISRKYFNKSFLILSLVNMFIYSLALSATQDLYKYITLNDTMLECIYGGVLNGIGMGLTFKARSSAGGIDLISAICKVKYEIPVKNTYLLVNVIVVSLGGILFGPKLALYTLISMYIASATMEVAKDSFNKQKSILLISDRYKEISKEIMTKMKSGVTFLEAEGAYTNNKKKLIYCIISEGDLSKFKATVYNIDENAFISINPVQEVRGGGFRQKFL